MLGNFLAKDSRLRVSRDQPDIKQTLADGRAGIARHTADAWAAYGTSQSSYLQNIGWWLHSWGETGWPSPPAVVEACTTEAGLSTDEVASSSHFDEPKMLTAAGWWSAAVRPGTRGICSTFHMLIFLGKYQATAKKISTRIIIWRSSVEPRKQAKKCLFNAWWPPDVIDYREKEQALANHQFIWRDLLLWVFYQVGKNSIVVRLHRFKLARGILYQIVSNCILE